MGLREKKADRTRRLLIDVAVELFFEYGFDQVTMEQIAEQAEIGTSTLYRYFPSKDLLLLAPLDLEGGLAGPLRDRPADEPIDLALGNAILEAARSYDSPERSTYILRIRDLIDHAPGPRARLWDTLAQESELLAEVIAERVGSPEVSAELRMTASLAMMVLGQAADAWRAGNQEASAVEYTHDALAMLASGAAIMPRVD
ncbi:MAG: TetR/AcrR family transcriptional regulator [Propionibacteriaceae bacterium]|jgi:AcrR family transcriptional regulator|nr:TetR/AcrR family transcriptional regulator [Propionibacteriaceae bacterium]